MDFSRKLKRAGKNLQVLYEEYVDLLGASGILDEIEQLWPKCHAEAMTPEK